MKNTLKRQAPLNRLWNVLKNRETYWRKATRKRQETFKNQAQQIQKRLSYV